MHRSATLATALAEGATVGHLQVADTKDELRELLSQDSRGVVITTIFRFKDAGLLNGRSNIVVMVDEAHRTQEGRLGLDMREALPNAKFIGLTGTPVSTDDRNTWAMFGDIDDEDGALNRYSVERSIYDGASSPVWEAAGPPQKNGSRQISLSALSRVSDTQSTLFD